MFICSASRSRRCVLGPMTSGSGAAPAPLIHALEGGHATR
jgi:hypothetical protein